MKLVHVLPFEIFLGGGERFIKNWIIHSSHESILYAMHPGNNKTLVDIPNTVYYQSYNELLTLLNQHTNDIIVLHSFPEGPIASIKNHYKVIWYVHGAYAFNMNANSFPKPFMCMSNYKPTIKRPSWDDVFIAAIPLGIDTNTFKISNTKNETGKIRVGIVSRISPEKLPLEFFKELKEFNTLPDSNQFEFMHFGAGVNDKFHQDYLKQISVINNWKVMGSFPHEKSNEMYHQFDLLLVPSVTETGSYAMLEAQASGLKVYCLNRDGMPYHVASQSKLFNNYKEMLNSLLTENIKDLQAVKTSIRKEIIDKHCVKQQIARLDFTVTL